MRTSIGFEQYFTGKMPACPFRPTQGRQGYGAFSYSKSQLKDIYAYIENQEEHHRKKTFKEEYLELLEDFGIDYKEKYLFAEI